MGTGTEKARSLYAIDGEMAQILAAMEEEDFDADTVQQAIDAWLDDNQEEISEKIDRYCAVIASKTVMAAARKAEANVLRRMAEQDERTAELLKERCMAFFARAGIERMETLRFRPRIQQNGGRLPLILPDRLEDVPEEYLVVKIIPMIETIHSALEAGKTIPGCSLGERGSHFRIR